MSNIQIKAQVAQVHLELALHGFLLGVLNEDAVQDATESYKLAVQELRYV